jgi:hypothetical protein
LISREVLKTRLFKKCKETANIAFFSDGKTNVEGKAILVEAWTGPWGSGKLRLPYFPDN